MASLKDAQKDAPKLDLESYIANYDGILRLERLVAIAQSPSPLSLEALRLAVAESKKGMNVDMYTSLVMALQKILPDDAYARIDTDWAETTNRRIKAETERLERELKAYKNNLIKESIRMGNEDLGNHYFAIGSYSNAFRYYSNMREFCTTPKHIAEMTLKLLFVSIAQRNWPVAQSYRLKMSGIGLRDEDRDGKYGPLLNACMGLSYLNLAAYRDAAETFLQVNPSYLTPEPLAGMLFQRQVLTPNDIAVYGGLCALATMDRNELQRRVLENQPFRQFLELESHLRRAISMFCSSKYSGCLSILEAYADDYNIDLYLQEHFSHLYRMVRSKCIVQWFSAFSVVTLKEMVKSFPAQDGSSIEDELENMIKSGQLDARIDLVDGVLISPNPNPRLTVLNDTLITAKSNERALRLRLHRINMLAAGLEVKAPQKPIQSPTGGLPTSAEGENSSVLFGLKGGSKKKNSGIMGSLMA